MKKSISAYLSDVSSNELSKLEDIITNHYKKFINMYFTIKDYSDKINSLNFKESKTDVLVIEIIFKSKKRATTVYNEIKDNFSKNNKISLNTKKIKLTLVGEE